MSQTNKWHSQNYMPITVEKYGGESYIASPTGIEHHNPNPNYYPQSPSPHIEIPNSIFGSSYLDNMPMNVGNPNAYSYNSYQYTPQYQQPYDVPLRNDYLNDNNPMQSHDLVFMTDELMKIMNKDQIEMVQQHQGGYLTREQYDYVMMEHNKIMMEKAKKTSDSQVYDSLQSKYSTYFEQQKQKDRQKNQKKVKGIIETYLNGEAEKNPLLANSIGDAETIKVFQNARKAKEEAKKAEERAKETGGPPPKHQTTIDFVIEKPSRIAPQETTPVMIKQDAAPVEFQIEKVERPRVYMEGQEEEERQRRKKAEEERLLRQLDEEKKKRELERKKELERQKEMEKKREAERQLQIQKERELERKRLEAEKQKEIQMEMEKKREMELQKQREREMQSQKEKEAEMSKKREIENSTNSHKITPESEFDKFTNESLSHDFDPRQSYVSAAAVPIIINEEKEELPPVIPQNTQIQNNNIIISEDTSTTQFQREPAFVRESSNKPLFAMPAEDAPPPTELETNVLSDLIAEAYEEVYGRKRVIFIRSNMRVPRLSPDELWIESDMVKRATKKKSCVRGWVFVLLVVASVLLPYLLSEVIKESTL